MTESGEAIMGSLLERLQAREQAARARVEALRAEMQGLAERVAAEEELLERLAITTKTVIEVLADDDIGGGAGAVGGAVGMSVSQQGVSRSTPSGMLVPVFVADGDVDGRVLPVAYRDVVEVLVQAGPLRAAPVCQALGIGGEPRHREGMRVKLKRLVSRGWLVEAQPGLFACADGVADQLAVANSGRGTPAADEASRGRLVKMKARGPST
jgi:hypothetical protein